MVEALPYADGEMVLAVRADALVFGEFELVDDLAAFRAALEQTAGDLELLLVVAAGDEAGFAKNSHGRWPAT